MESASLIQYLPNFPPKPRPVPPPPRPPTHFCLAKISFKKNWLNRGVIIAGVVQ